MRRLDLDLQNFSPKDLNLIREARFYQGDEDDECGGCGGITFDEDLDEMTGPPEDYDDSLRRFPNF